MFTHADIIAYIIEYFFYYIFYCFVDNIIKIGIFAMKYQFI